MNETFLNGRTALVTGATRGIGFAIAHALADAGATVAICGRSQNSVDRGCKPPHQPHRSVKWWEKLPM